MNNNEQVAISWDWKEQPDLSALEKLGIFIYEDPLHEGSDQFGYIFSKKKLTPEEVKAVSNKINGIE